MPDLEVPAFAPPYRELKTMGGGHVLVGGAQYAVVEGDVAVDLLRRIDGERTLWDLTREMETTTDPAVAHLTALLLAEEGLLVDASMIPEPAPLEPAPPPPADGPALVGPHSETAAARWLAHWLGPWSRPETRVLVLPSPFVGDLVDHVTRAMGDAHQVIPIGVSDFDLWFGPTFGPAGPCVGCLTARLYENLPAHRADWDGALPFPEPRWSHAGQLRAKDFLQEALEGLAPGPKPEDPRAGSLLTVDLLTGATTTHRFSRTARCMSCGTSEPPRPAPQLEARHVTARSNTGSRIRTPADTLHAIDHQISPLTGAVRWVRPVAAEVSLGPFYVFTAGHAASLSIPSADALKLGSRDQSGGKGTTPDEARASALCEALERYSAIADDSAHRLRGALSDIPDALHPNECMLFSDRQYGERDEWNAGGSGRFHYVPEPFDPDAEVEWCALWSLDSGAVRRLPAAYCHLGWIGPGSRFCKADSNGLAAGNCLEEAILQGLLELVERDAVAIWWYNRLARPAAALDAEDPFVAAAIRHLEAMGRTTWLLDATSDLGVPVRVAVSAQARDGSEIMLGFGAHLDSAIACRRALLEIGQSIPIATRSPEARRKQLLPDHPLAVRWWESETLQSQSHLVPSPGSEEAPPHVGAASHDLRVDIQTLVERLKEAGLDTLVADLSKPETGLRVVRVVVPGLRHFWRRFAPGRLTAIPVTLGWRKSETREAELNPFPIFL